LQHVAGPAVAVRPEWTLWADLSIRIIFALLVGAAYDPIGHDDRFGAILLHERAAEEESPPWLSRDAEPSVLERWFSDTKGSFR
jgi:hypothetical protein